MYFGPKQTAVAIFLLSFCLRAGWLATMPEHDIISGQMRGDELVSTDEGINTASAIAAGRGFSDPFFNNPTGPSAHCSPAFPAVTALIFSVFGVGLAGGIVRDLVCIAGYSLLFALLPAAAAALGLDRAAGAITGTLAASFPLYRQNEVSAGRDEWLAAILLLLLTLYAWSVARRDKPAMRSALILGAGWGALMYVEPPMLLVLPLHLAILLAARARPLRWRLSYSAVVCSAFLLVVAPWTVRNRVVMGGWFFMRDNAGLELEISNGGGAFASFEANATTRWICVFHPDCNVEAGEFIRSHGEVEFNRRAMANAVAWITSNPAPFAELTVRRAIAVWCAMRAYPVTFFLRTSLSLLGAIGLWLMWRRGLRLQAQLVGAVWLAFPITFYLIQYSDRYVAPMAPAILLPAGYAIWSIVERRGSESHPGS